MADGTGAAPVPAGMEEVPPSAADQAARLQGFVQAGGRAAILLCPSRAARAAQLDRMLAELPNHATRAGNPLASPLTLHRLLFQIGAGAGDGEGGDALLRCLQERAGPAGLAVLAVDDAHTLAPDALAALAQVPSPAVQEQPGRLLILAGHPDLVPGLSGSGLAALHDPARVLVLRTRGADDGALELAAPAGTPGGPAGGSVGSDPVPLPASPAGGPAPGRTVALRLMDLPVRMPGRPAGWRRSRPLMLAAGAAGAAVLAASALLWDGPAAGPAEPTSMALPLAPPAAPVQAPVPGPAPAAAPMPVPTPADAASVAGSASAPPVADAPAPEAQRFTPLPRPAAVPSDAGLRRDFDVFLDRAGHDTAGLSPANREALFREYLEWRGGGQTGRFPDVNRPPR